MKWLCFIFILLFNAKSFPQENTDILYLEKIIPTDEIDGYSPKGSPEYFVGDELFSYINGGADIYLEYGISAAASLYYENDNGSRIHLEIYLMENPDAAFGIYSLNSNEKGEIMESLYGRIYGSYLDFSKNRAFVRISSATGIGESEKITLVKLAEKAGNAIAGEFACPLLLSKIDPSAIELTMPKYFKGLIALNNIYSFGSGTIHGFDEGISGDYKNWKIFLFSYKDEKTRYEWVQNAIGKIKHVTKFQAYTEQENGFSVIDKNQIPLSFRSFGKYLAVIIGPEWKDALPLYGIMEHTLL